MYGADGNRVKKTVSGAVTLYLVAQVNPTGYPQVVEELTVSGGTTNLNKIYTYGLDLISQKQITGSVISFFGYDGLGSVRFLTGTNGAVSDTYVYEAYGTQITSSGSGTSNNYRFTGEEVDADLNMYYLRARYYKNGTGRFVTMDSFEGNEEDPLSLHRYLYANANPVINVDPSGHFLLIDIMASLGIRYFGGYRYVQYAYRGYQAYSRIQDAIDIGKAFYWVAALTAAVYVDAADHAGTLDAQAEDLGIDAAQSANDSGIYQEPGLSGPAAASFGALGIWAIFETAAEQAHHIATDKHSVWTPRFERIFKRAGLSLQDPSNLIDVKGHGGPHPEQYHKEIYRRLVEAVRGKKPGSEAMKKAAIAELKKLGKECARPGSQLNKMILKRIFR